MYYFAIEQRECASLRIALLFYSRLLSFAFADWGRLRFLAHSKKT